MDGLGGRIMTCHSFLVIFLPFFFFPLASVLSVYLAFSEQFSRCLQGKVFSKESV